MYGLPFLYSLDAVLLRHPIAYFFLEITLKTSIIILLAMLVHFCMRRQSASNNSLIWLVALVAALSVPLISLVLPQLTLELEFISPAADFSQALETSATSASTFLQSTFIDGLLSFFAMIYVTGILLMGCYLAIGISRLLLLSSSSREIEATPIKEILDQLKAVNGVNTKIQLRSSTRISTPLTWGILRHKILLPVTALQWDKNLLLQALSHELGHIQRHDWLYHILAKLSLCLFWPNPLVWKAARSLQIESEKACDDAAIDCTNSEIDYAKNLLTVAAGIKNNSPFLAVGLFSRPSILSLRIRHILAPGMRRSFLRSDEINVSVISVLFFVVPFSALNLTTRIVNPQDKQPGTIAVSFKEEQQGIIEESVVDIKTPKPEGIGALGIENELAEYFPGRGRVLMLTSSFPTNTIDQLEFNWEQGPDFSSWESMPLHMPDPRYPLNAINRGVEGHVVAEFSIDPEGKVFDAKIIESVPTGTFDKTVLAAVNSFIYCPQIVNGISGNTRSVKRKFSFTLADSI